MKKTLAGLCLMVLLLTLTACQREETVNADFADPMTEEVLLAINSGDYDTFSKNFNETNKAQLPQVFNTQILAIKELIGDYKEGSKELISAKEVDKNYIQVVYNTDYTNEEGNVIITIIFNKDESNRVIEGFYMNSPKIQKM